MFTTKDITVAGVAKKQVYKLVGMEDENGKIVQIKVWDGEYTREDVLNQVETAKQGVTEANSRLEEMNNKLEYFPI